ncbi:hypothetical protein A8950_2467 [Dongia mobilis]|uniref:Pyridoxamine 5'-phosphate oxidase N-terminal domain-containing protein n=1 Tax=Dongia mobilis TaxID=578943 RepID=A0A4R6WPJ8_9PROT|nr:pyridoxamine 5'-phosphate oxidase family protein [Dongia mobilis]TDQ81399.1 hypothetical protein A8950_2467 [Dongia mobilis]
MNDQSNFLNPDSLRALYGPALPTSLSKEVPFLTEPYADMIRASPFVVIATAGEEGLDCSPRGGPPGFVRVVDPKTLMLPDRSGNNRVDTLSNIVSDGRIAMLFLVPGCGETMRVNGRARVSDDTALCESFADANGKVPRSVIIITVESAYVHCSQAFSRSKLWDPAAQVDRRSLPSMGTMLQSAANAFDGAKYDRDLAAEGGLVPDD